MVPLSSLSVSLYFPNAACGNFFSVYREITNIDFALSEGGGSEVCLPSVEAQAVTRKNERASSKTATKDFVLGFIFYLHY